MNIYIYIVLYYICFGANILLCIPWALVFMAESGIWFPVMEQLYNMYINLIRSDLIPINPLVYVWPISLFLRMPGIWIVIATGIISFVIYNKCEKGRIQGKWNNRITMLYPCHLFLNLLGLLWILFQTMMSV